MPVAAVREAGMPFISSGSLTAILGVTRQSTMAIFTLRVVSVMMQNRVISEAVPAVVLMAMQGHHVRGGLVHALIVPDVSAVGGHQADALGAVVGGTAAQRDHAVAAVLLIKGETGLYIGILGVRLCPAEHERIRCRTF